MSGNSEFIRELKQFQERVRFVRGSIRVPIEDLSVVTRLDTMLDRLEAVEGSEQNLDSAIQQLRSIEELLHQMCSESPKIASLVYSFRCQSAIRMLEEFIVDIDRLRVELSGPDIEFCEKTSEQARSLIWKCREGVLPLTEVHKLTSGLLLSWHRFTTNLLKNSG